VALSSDGTRLASVSSETIRVWDAQSGRPVGETLQEPKRSVMSSVTSVAFSPGGARLASGSGDGTIRVWDVKSGRPVGEPMQGHQGWVLSVAFSPDGMRLASGSQDQTIRLWDLSIEPWKTNACRIANRNMTKEEWKQYMGDPKDYHKTCPDLPIPADDLISKTPPSKQD
jgi:WD40 repeat protein